MIPFARGSSGIFHSAIRPALSRNFNPLPLRLFASVAPENSGSRTPSEETVQTRLKREELGKLVRRTNLELVPKAQELTYLEQQDELFTRRRKQAAAGVPLRRMKPRTPSLRWWIRPVYSYLHKGKPEWSLTVAQRKKGGRNNTGKIAMRHRGGGHKRRLRLLDFQRQQPGAQTVVRIEYDPGRTAHIALLRHNTTGTLSYIVAADGMMPGDTVESFRAGIPEDLTKEMGGTFDAAIFTTRTAHKGNCFPISMLPIGSIVHCIGITRNGPAKLCRAAGTYGRILEKLPEKGKAIIRLQSGEHRYVHLEACCSLGIVSNPDHQHLSLGKAGRSRNMGRRPKVRGLAMNKVDHPHGGGRGKKKSHKLSMSPWGTLAKGYKTRRGKNVNRMKVQDRRVGLKG